MSAAARASLLILGAAAFMVSADARVIDPLLRVIADEFQAPVGRTSIVVSAYTLPYGLFQLLYGPLGDRIGKLRVMRGALTLFALGTAACALVPNLPVFALLRFLTGIVAAAIIPLSLGYIGDKVPYETRQVALGRFMSALMLGQILSSSLGGFFGEHLGWRRLFLVFGGVALLVAGGLWREAVRFPEAVRPERRFAFRPYLDLAARPLTRLVLGTVFLEGFFVFGGQPFLGPSLRDHFHLRYDQIGLMLGGIGLGGLIYSVSVKRLVARLGELGILLLGGSLLALGYVAVAALTAWWQFFPCVLVIGMGYFTMHSTLQTRATELAPEARGTAVSLFAFSFFLGQAVGAMALGAVVEAWGYRVAFVLTGLGLLALALWARRQFARHPRPAPPRAG